MIWILLVIAIASGVLGRMGGAHGYDTKYRDVGCSALVVLAFGTVFGWYWSSFWWVYLLVFVLHWGAFSTYWDELFGYDNMWFSGLMTGLALSPVLFMDIHLWWLVVSRTIALALIWWALNKFLPQQVFFWRRDVAEEFLRYFHSL